MASPATRLAHQGATLGTDRTDQRSPPRGSRTRQAVTSTHYETIGVSPNADRDHIRRAYLKRARLLHPDRFSDRPEHERAKAERRMQDLNAAWSVVSDEKKRAAYDRAIRDASPRATGPLREARPENEFRPFDTSEPFLRPRSSGPQVASDRDMEITGFARLMRTGPLLVLLGTFLAIFIVTAYLGSRGGTTPVQTPGGPQSIQVPPTGTPMQCISIFQGSVDNVPCNGPKDALVWSIAPRGETCPSDLDTVYRPNLGGSYCVTME